MANPALQTLKVISHSTSKIVPKSASGQCSVCDVQPGQRLVTSCGARVLTTPGHTLLPGVRGQTQGHCGAEGDCSGWGSDSLQTCASCLHCGELDIGNIVRDGECSMYSSKLGVSVMAASQKQHVETKLLS